MSTWYYNMMSGTFLEISAEDREALDRDQKETRSELAGALLESVDRMFPEHKEGA